MSRAHKYSGLIVSAGFLADILFYANSGHIKFFIEPSGGCITKQRQGGCICGGFISSEIQSGMRGWYKRRNRPSLFTKAHFSGLYVYADSASSGQFIQGTPFRKSDPV